MNRQLFMVRLYNTLTRTVEEFKPQNPNGVTYYSCGPTVYDFAHIGHARTFIFADLLQRVLEMNGFPVKRVMNITDVGHLTSDSDTGEDKMEKGALREKKSVWDISAFYTDDFMQMLKKLNIEIPSLIPKATDHVSEMIVMVQTLMEKGYTYTIHDGIYFDTSRFPEYGALTGFTFEELQKRLKAGARIEMTEGKKHPTDFALWKFTPAGVKRQMEWESPWGKGFPGWHIECSAMSMKYLGETLDIHTGGVDHIPIHHTNEIAQSEGATGKEFVRYWLHGEHLLINGEKMSKSLGNFIRVSDVEKKGFSPLALRYLFLTASYRQQMNFTWESLQQAQNALQSVLQHVKFIKADRQAGVSSMDISTSEPAQRFMEALNTDLNAPKGVAIMQDVLKSSSISRSEKYDLLGFFDRVLGLNLLDVTTEIPDEIMSLVKRRDQLKQEKKYNESDAVRLQIEQKGYVIQDTPAGTKIVPK